MKTNPLFIQSNILKPLMWLSLTLISFVLKAQAVKTNMTSAFYTAYCYLQTDNLQTYNFVATDDVGGTPTTINFAGNNNGSAEIALPANFDFTFYCEKISKLRVGVDGLILIDDATTTIPANNFPQIKSIKTKLAAPFFDELQLGNGSVNYQYKGVQGSATNPYRLVIHWSQVSLAALNDFNVKLDFWAEFITGTNEIVFYYKDVQVIDDITDPDNQILIGNHEFGKDASFGLRGSCSTGDFLDGVNNAANAIQNGVSLKDFASPSSIACFRFTPKNTGCPINPTSENITICEDAPAFDLPKKTIAINGNWEGNGVAFVTPNPATTSDLNGIVAKFDPRDPGNYVVTWNPGCPLFSYNVNIRVDEQPKILTLAKDLFGCGQSQFVVTAATPSVNTVGLPVWTKLNGSTTSPTFPTTNNPITIQGVSNIVNLELTNGLCKTSVRVENGVAGGVPLPPISVNDCSGLIALSVNVAGASAFNWSLAAGTPSNIILISSATNTATVSGLTRADVATVNVQYRDGNTCVTQPFRVSAGGGEASVGGNVNDQTVSQCNNNTFFLTANAPASPAVGRWEFVGVPPSSISLTPSVNSTSVTVSGVPTGLDVKVQWIIGILSGNNLTCTDTLVVTLKNFAPVTAKIISTDQAQCGNGFFNLNAENPAPYTGSWVIVSGDGIVQNPTNFNTSISGVVGSTVVQWVVTSGFQNPPCTDASAQITLTNNPKPVPGLGSFARQQCDNSLFIVTGIVSSGASGEWRYAADKSLISTNATTGIAVNAGTSENVYWLVFTPNCRDSAFVTLTNYPKNVANITTPNPQKLCNTSTFSIAATPAAGGSWSKVSGSGSIFSPNSASTMVTGVTAGTTTVVRWSVSNPICPSDFKDLTLTNDAPSNATVNPDINVCETAGLTVNLAATNVTGSGSWTTTSTDLNFGTAGNLTTTATVATPSVGLPLTATFCATNGVCPTVCKDVKLKIDQNVAASITVAPNSPQCDNGTFVLMGNTPSVFTAKTWSKVSGFNVLLPADLTISPLNINLPAGETVTLRWTTTNGACASNSQVTLRNVAKPKVTLVAAKCPSTPINLDNLISELIGEGTWSGAGTFSGSLHNVKGGKTDKSFYTPTAMELACGKVDLSITVQNPDCPDVASASVSLILGMPIVTVKELTLNLGDNCTAVIDKNILRNSDYKYFTIKVCSLFTKIDGICKCTGGYLPKIDGERTVIDGTFIGKELGVEVSDACGNKGTSCVTVVDGQPPVIVCPADVVLFCSELKTNEKPSPTLTGDLGLDNTPLAIDGEALDCLPLNVNDERFVDYDFTADCRRPFVNLISNVYTPIPTVIELSAAFTQDVTLTVAQVNQFAIDMNSAMNNVSSTGDVIRFIVRIWRVKDRNGNLSLPCFQLISVRRASLEYLAPTLPDVTYNCSGNDAVCGYLAAPSNLSPNTTGWPTVQLDFLDVPPIASSGNKVAILEDKILVLNGQNTCNISVNFKDDTTKLCNGSFKINRIFTVMDMCVGVMKTVTQTIKVLDFNQPIATAEYLNYAKTAGLFCYQERGTTTQIPTSTWASKQESTTFDGYSKTCGKEKSSTKQTVYATSDPNKCTGYVEFKITACDPKCTNGDVTINTNDSRLKLLRTRTFTDANGIFSRETFYGGTFENVAGGDLVDHSVSFKIDDACSNATATQDFDIKVVDNASPNVVCISSLTIPINTEGVARIFAPNFNNGSTDNCGSIDKFFVKRMDNKMPSVSDNSTANKCGILVNAPDCFADYVDFGCADGGKDVMVILRAMDASGNVSDCMVIVSIQNKGLPTCIPPPPVTTFCDSYSPNGVKGAAGSKPLRIEEQLAQADVLFGLPFASDNCGTPTVTSATTKNLNNCIAGTVTRTWTVTACSGKTSTCSQVITVKTTSDFTVDFPDDKVFSCSPNIIHPDIMKKQMLEANAISKYKYGIQNDGCGRIEVQIKDDTLMGASSFCVVIYRKITVIDGCKYVKNNTTAASAFGLPLDAQDVHDNPNWATENDPAWEFLSGRTNPKTRRFRDADGLGGNFDDGLISFVVTYKVFDNTPPVPTPKTDEIVCNTEGVCAKQYKTTLQATDKCDDGTLSTGPLFFNWKIFLIGSSKGIRSETEVATGNSATISSTLPVNLAGENYEVRWSVRDLCNKLSDVMAYKITVNDCEGPMMEVKSINVELSYNPTSNSGMAMLKYGDIKIAIRDNCTSDAQLLDVNVRMEKGNNTVAVTRANYAAVPHGAQTLMFNCTDYNNAFIEPTTGKHLVYVRVWTVDAAGNPNYIVSTINLQDNANACSLPRPLLSATVKTENNQAVKDVIITATNENTNFTGNTEGSGLTNILLNGNLNYTVKAEKTLTDDKYAGITTFDIARISKSLLDVEKLTSPYALIAADVDMNGEIEGADMLYIRNFILRKTNNLNQKLKVWRFVDKTYTFRNEANPMGEDFRELVNLAKISGNVSADFVAVKLGDVNNTFLTNNGVVVRSAKNWDLTTDDISMSEGNEYTINISAEKFDASTFQGTFGFKNGFATVESVKSSLKNWSDGNFALFGDKMTTSWNSPKGAIEKAENVLSITFIAHKSGKLSDNFSVSNELTPAVANDNFGTEMNVVLNFKNGKTTGGSEFALYQNQPNPLSISTNISFNLPADGKAHLTIYNVEGRVLKTIEGDFKAGLNNINVQKTEIGANGVLYYRLDTPENSATKKMIVIE